MSIYLNSNGLLKPVSKKRFDLEKDIQKLTEKNLETLFGLKFVSGSLNKEFSISASEQDFYIDTLAFDQVQKSIVIIEYKKDKSISVIDQGFAYLSSVLNHKADLILELNERLNKNLKKESIDWEATRVIFISPEFTNYQRNAINFKDLPIFLYEVKLYDNNLLEYDPIKPYRTTESISKLSNDKTIQKVTKEIKSVTEENIIPKSEKVQKIYKILKNKILEHDGALIFHPTKYYIGIQRQGNWRVISALNFYTNKIMMDFNRSQPKDFDDPQKKVQYRSESMKHYGQHISNIAIYDEKDIEYVFKMFLQLLNRFDEKFS